MAKNYTYKEIRDALLASGFEEVKNNHGSHQLFVCKKTGFMQPVPKHSNGMVATGTAESILEYVVMQARIANINIANDRYKLSNNVIDFIKYQHKRIKQNIIFLIPQDIRRQNHLYTEQDVRKFLNEKIKQCRTEYNNKNGMEKGL